MEEIGISIFYGIGLVAGLIVLAFLLWLGFAGWSSIQSARRCYYCNQAGVKWPSAWIYRADWHDMLDAYSTPEGICDAHVPDAKTRSNFTKLGPRTPGNVWRAVFGLKLKQT